MIYEPKQGFRQGNIVDRRTKIEFAHTMKSIADLYPDASVIRVVLDNLNTHKVASLHESCPAEQARNLVRRLEFHTTPRHGSWLNSAEIFHAFNIQHFGGRVHDARIDIACNLLVE